MVYNPTSNTVPLSLSHIHPKSHPSVLSKEGSNLPLSAGRADTCHVPASLRKLLAQRARFLLNPSSGCRVYAAATALPQFLAMMQNSNSYRMWQKQQLRKNDCKIHFSSLDYGAGEESGFFTPLLTS